MTPQDNLLPLPAPDDPDASVELLSFRVGGEEFCLPIAQVREIRVWSEPTPLPQSDAAVEGVINLRGTVLPVIDLARGLALANARTAQRPVIVVVEDGSRMAGLIVDSVSDIVVIPRAGLEPPPAIPVRESRVVLSALALHNGRFLRILDPSALLPTRPRDAG